MLTTLKSLNSSVLFSLSLNGGKMICHLHLRVGMLFAICPVGLWWTLVDPWIDFYTNTMQNTSLQNCLDPAWLSLHQTPSSCNLHCVMFDLKKKILEIQIQQMSMIRYAVHYECFVYSKVQKRWRLSHS